MHFFCSSLNTSKSFKFKRELFHVKYSKILLIISPLKIKRRWSFWFGCNSTIPLRNQERVVSGELYWANLIEHWKLILFRRCDQWTSAVSLCTAGWQSERVEATDQTTDSWKEQIGKTVIRWHKIYLININKTTFQWTDIGNCEYKRRIIPRNCKKETDIFVKSRTFQKYHVLCQKAFLYSPNI